RRWRLALVEEEGRKMRAGGMTADGHARGVPAMGFDVVAYPAPRLSNLFDDVGEPNGRHEGIVHDDRDGASRDDGLGDEGEVVLRKHAPVAAMDEDVDWASGTFSAGKEQIQLFLWRVAIG